LNLGAARVAWLWLVPNVRLPLMSNAVGTFALAPVSVLVADPHPVNSRPAPTPAASRAAGPLLLALRIAVLLLSVVVAAPPA
jgi:hypothetical protein